MNMVGGIRIGWGNRSTRRDPTPVPLCPPHIAYHLTLDRTRAAAVGSRPFDAIQLIQFREVTK
jgi:hypothetical protein